MSIRDKLTLLDAIAQRNREHEAEFKERRKPMSEYRLTRAEQETTITWDEEEKIARIYTASPVTMRKLDKLVEEFPDDYQLTQTFINPAAKRYTVPARYIRFGKPASEARREANRRNGERTQQNRF